MPHRTVAESRGGRRFATTQWSVVLAAGAGEGSQGRDALGALIQTYWPPVYAYLRSRGHSPDAAADLTQGFFASLLERGSIGGVRRERGRFRSYLLGALKHFVANEHERASATKRGGEARIVSIDRSEEESSYEPVDPLTPDAIFERRWARTVLDRAMALVGEDMERTGSGDRFRLLAPHLTGHSDAPLAEVACQLGMTESAVKVALHRLRRRYGAILRDQIAQTLDDDGTVDDELRYLIELVAP